MPSFYGTLQKFHHFGFGNAKKPPIDSEFLGVFTSAVFVGCVRNAAPHLPQVLENLERWSLLFEKSAFVFVENDSTDGSKDVLKRWIRKRKNGHLLNLDGLADRNLIRTSRIAEARNTYLDYVRNSKYADFQHLVILDFDDVNAVSISERDLAAAIRFLDQDADIAAVFANSSPIYYDVWALRHAEWSPDDCWAAVRASTDLSAHHVLERHVYSRQRFIPSDSKPVEVDSAFGGLGIYRMVCALTGRYDGASGEGSALCEHVPFNLAVGRQGKLYIFPGLRNSSPSAHLRQDLSFIPTSRELAIEQCGRTCRLLAPSHHRLDVYRKAHPLYDRRLPQLAAIVSRDFPNAVIIDVGANIGDTVALCRLAGCDAPFVAVEPSTEFFWYLAQNFKSRPELFAGTTLVNAFIGPPGARLTACEHNGTARTIALGAEALCDDSLLVPTISFDDLLSHSVSLIKTDTDGFDAEILANNLDFIRRELPILWVEIESRSQLDERRWQDLFDALCGTHELVCIFDNFGLLVDHGRTRNLSETIISILKYARRQQRLAGDAMGQARIYYLDVAFFPLGAEQAYLKFLSNLPEASA